MDRTLPRATTYTGIALILATGLIHLLDAPGSFAEARYKGLLFVANGAGALLAAVGVYRGARSWGWGLGTLVAGGALVGYVLSRTVGLPGLPVDPWLEPLGVASLVVEALFLLVSFQALRAPRPAGQRR